MVAAFYATLVGEVPQAFVRLRLRKRLDSFGVAESPMTFMTDWQ